MSDLKILQHAFQAYLLEEPENVAAVVDSRGSLPVSRRLGIYKEAYQARLLEALAHDYPALARILGPQAFQEASRQYQHNYPSKYRSLRWFGQYFPQFLRAKALYLAELAEFEWKISLAFDAEDAPPFTLEQMTLIPPAQWPDLRFRPSPSLQRITVFTNAITLWQQIMDNETLSPATEHEQSSSWLIWRTDYTPRFTKLTDKEAFAVDALIQGLSFAELCEGLCSFVSEEEAGVEAAGLLKTWIVSGWLCDVILPNPVAP